ncbi:ovostatin homolog 2-like [Corticium candelabrum]|uniref:ovostatin homolog 2-like n=1 Tax=Corticium candelabrum TaxID=121492 RepID=UPI002E265E89|nr:ovostatin homolog 2-like [Corticium candelabrum]
MGRAVVLNRQTKSATGAVSVTLQNPLSYMMGRYSNVTLDYGVAKFEFPISSEPVLGTHRVCATYEGLPKGQRSCFEFEVQRYVLPKFSCTITPTDEALSCSPKSVCFSVSAKYTYGQRVQGTLSASAVLSRKAWRCHRREIELKKISGTTSMCLRVCSNYYFCDGDVVIDVNVTDSSSQTTVHCKGKTSVPVRINVHQLTIIDDDDSFHACHATVVKVAASTLSGNPKAANISLDVSTYAKNKASCMATRPRSLQSQYQVTDHRGIATFSVCMPCNALRAIFRASVVSYQASQFPTAYSFRRLIYSPERIVLSSKKQKLLIGETANITASFSNAAVADYYVVDGGQIIDNGRCSPNSDRKARKRHKQLCKMGRVRRTCYISFVVTSSMAPKFTLIVSQKTLGASRIEFEVIQSHSTDSSISLEFQHKQVKPGEKTNLLIKAPPMSYVGVVAVDQSVYIQQNKNQLTPSKLYQELDMFDEHKQFPVESYFYRIVYEQSSGIQLSDRETEPPKTCQKPNPPPKPDVTYNCCYNWSDYVVAALATPSAVNTIETGSESDNVVSPSRVRTHFPETWLWFDRKNRNSTLNEEVVVPDTITSWVADAFAVSPLHSMSIARPATLTVFKPFFVTINLPYSVIRGELVEITLTVYNYLQTMLTASVDVHVDINDARLVLGKRDKTPLNQRTRTLDVVPGNGEVISYFLLPLRNGHLPITATARSTLGADSLIRNLLVEPEGVKEEYSQSSLLCLQDNDDDNSTSKLRSDDNNHRITYVFNASLPPEFVPDSERAFISITGNYMGSTIDGLENLLRLPTGCGEQNMLNFAPAVYIARYLDTVGKLDNATRKKALRFMQTGYQREMTYQREDGSYSAFGNRDRCGSMWLTAFVLRSFGQADGVLGMSIDERVQNEAVQFVKKHQNADGSFPSICSPIDKEMQGCSGGRCSLTAYVTLALLEAGISPKDESIKLALDYLSNRCIAKGCSSPYNLALIAFTLSRADKETENAFKALRKCAVIEGNHTHWQYSNERKCRNTRPWSYYCRTRSCDVETTAYALLAFTNRGNIAYSFPIVRWLIEQRNLRGGFKSTQDTVVALHALSEYAKLTKSDGRVVAEVSINANQTTQTVSLDSSNAMLVQTITLPSLPTLVNVNANGKGCILAAVGVKYNVPKPDKTRAFQVFAKSLLQRDSCKYLVRVCNRWLQTNPETSNMAITEITFFSGFQPIQSELKQLEQSNRCNIKRTDFKGRALSVYFEEVTQTRCCFDVTMKRASVVEDLQGVPVITYNYYEPDERGGTMLYPHRECP